MGTVTGESFRQALGRFASGVTVITVHDDTGDHGMTASAFCSVSLDPPLILVCIKNGNRSYELIEKSGAFAVNLLARDQVELSNRFAGGYLNEDGEWQMWPEGQQTFTDLEFRRGEVSQAPLLAGSLAQLDCSLDAIHPGGDHGIFVGRVRGIYLDGQGGSDPLLYFSGAYGSYDGGE